MAQRYSMRTDGGSPLPYLSFLIHADHHTIPYGLFLESSKKKKQNQHTHTIMSSPTTQRLQNSNATEIHPAKEMVSVQPTPKIYTTTASYLYFFPTNTSNLTCASLRYLHVGYMKGITTHATNYTNVRQAQ